MAQQGDIKTINGVPHTYVNGKWVAVGEQSLTEKVLTGNYVGSGQAGAIAGVLDATGPTTSPAGMAAIDRLQNQADRQACNASGGFYTQGGACLSGQEAEDQVNKILNNPDAPDVLKQRAEAWQERNVGETEDTTTDDSAISDEEAISAVLASLPDKLKGIFNEQNIMTVLEAVIDDPMTKIKKDMGAGVEIIFDEGTTWEDWKVFGPLAIPGIPLPPGIIDVTLKDIADAAEAVGGSISEIVNGILTKPDETIKGIGTEILSTVRGVFEGTKDDPGFGGTLGTFKDWVLTTMGGGLGGLIFTTISNEASTIFGGDTGATPIVPGGAEDEEKDIFVDTTSAEEQFNNLLGTVTSLTDNNVTSIETGGTDDDVDDTNELGGRRQAEVGTRERELFIPGGDDDRRKPDPDDGGGNGRTVDNRNQDIFIPDPEPPKPIEIGGYTDDVVIDPEPTPDPIEIGGPEPTPTPSGGGGSVGGGTGTADPFIRAIQHTPTVPIAIRQQAPVDYASGLMSPNTSMDAIGQLIFRNLA